MKNSKIFNLNYFNNANLEICYWIIISSLFITFTLWNIFYFIELFWIIGAEENKVVMTSCFMDQYNRLEYLEML